MHNNDIGRVDFDAAMDTITDRDIFAFGMTAMAGFGFLVGFAVWGVVVACQAVLS